MNCANCAKPFRADRAKPKVGRTAPQRFCSRACAADAMRVHVTCAECPARTKSTGGSHPLCEACRNRPCTRCQRSTRAAVHPDTPESIRKHCYWCRRDVTNDGHRRVA